jgi:hypothetical protein
MNPMKNVPGRVEEPDTAHDPNVTKEYDLTLSQVGSLISPEFDVRKSARKQVGRELETFSQRNFILNN